jgi:hypothetical protein
MKKLTREQELALAKKFDDLLIASMPRYVFTGGMPPPNNDHPPYVHKEWCASKTIRFVCTCQCTS